jgi:hypothetical protein
MEEYYDNRRGKDGGRKRKKRVEKGRMVEGHGEERMKRNVCFEED